MADRRHDHSHGRCDSRDNSPRRDQSSRQSSRYREQSPNERDMLRREIQAMMSRLKTLEDKTRASPLPVRSRDCDRILVSDRSCDRRSLRRPRTSSLERNTSRPPSRLEPRSMRRSSPPPERRRRLVSPLPTDIEPRRVSPTRGYNYHRHSRSRSRTQPLQTSVRGSDRLVRDANESTNLVQATVTDRIVDAIRLINTGGRSQNFYISNFDPTLHNIDDWCAEVDRARALNNWSDYESLSRIGNCLKGDAQLWLNEWVTNDERI